MLFLQSSNISILLFQILLRARGFHIHFTPSKFCPPPNHDAAANESLNTMRCCPSSPTKKYELLTQLSLSGTETSSISEDGEAIVDLQSDSSKYARGISHLSADLNEGDVIAYQCGTWYVDGTEVGDGTDPVVKYALVDTIQVVWTHDCEHGVIRGFELLPIARSGSLNANDFTDLGICVEKGSKFLMSEEYIQLGPEQLIARIPTTPSEDDGVLMSLAGFDPKLQIMTHS